MKILFIIKKIEIINKKEFVAITLNKKNKIFILYITIIIKSIKMMIYLFYKV